MQASFERTDGVVVVELKGRLDFETSEPFRRTCLEKLIRERVVFDLRDLNFVGSLGLKDFVDTLETLADRAPRGVKFCGVSSDFRRLFEALPTLATHLIYESPAQAISSW